MYRLFLCIATLAASASASAQVLKQRPLGRNACGPCAVVNSLTISGNHDALAEISGHTPLEKGATLCRQFKATNSEVFGDQRTVYSDEHGTADADLALMINPALRASNQPLVTSCYLARKHNESRLGFVKRINQTLQQSLRAGFHPLLATRAVAAQFDNDRQQFTWNSMGGHWIAIHAAEDVSEDGRSFLIKFSDSLSGTLQTGFVNLDQYRRGRSPMRFDVDDDGEEQWEWVSSDQTLMLTAPGMPLGTTRARWNERTFIVLRFAIYRSGSTAIQRAAILQRR